MISSPLVAIIDDAADYRLLIKHLFGRHFPSYWVAFFADGHDFLLKLPHLNPLPSLILLDRHMPILDGHQTLLRLKAHPVYRKIPVVMMSAEASAEEINGCYEAGVNSFLRKPISLSLLEEQLGVICQYWLELHQQPAKLV